MAVEPSVAEHHAHGIGPALELDGNIIGHVERAPVITCVTRIQQVVANFFAVEIKLIVAEATNRDAGLTDLAFELKAATQQRCRMGGGIGGAGNPLGLPIAGLEQAHFPTCRLALDRLARLVPDADFPECLPA